MAVFKNSSLQTTIKNFTGSHFRWLVSFGSLVDTNTTYYGLDDGLNKTIIFDSNWQYLGFKSFSNPVYMITMNKILYITCYRSIHKTDKYLNILSQYNSSTVLFNGLYFNALNNRIYVAESLKIFIFDLNLTLVDSFLTPGYSSWSIQGYNKPKIVFL